MLSLANDQLVVSILDPVQDRVRLGSRYCTGGYVYEVADRRLGVITSGPGYPSEEYPPVFDGQGLPEAFRDPLWAGAGTAAPGSLPPPGTTMLVLGVGLVRATAPEQIRDMPVDEFCAWQIAQSPGKVAMETRQALAGWQLALTRELTLEHRTLRSETTVANVGREPLRFRWFPHPFYPHPHGECCRFNGPVSFPDNPGFELLASGFVGTKTDHEWDRRGHFQAVQRASAEPLVVLQRHPKLGLVAATCSYAPVFLPIWGNCNTFSFEPYTEEAVAPGEEAIWSITYDF